MTSRQATERDEGYDKAMRKDVDRTEKMKYACCMLDEARCYASVDMGMGCTTYNFQRIHDDDVGRNGAVGRRQREMLLL